MSDNLFSLPREHLHKYLDSYLIRNRFLIKNYYKQKKYKKNFKRP